MSILRWLAVVLLLTMTHSSFAQRADSTIVRIHAINKYKGPYGFEVSGNLWLVPSGGDAVWNCKVRTSDNFVTVLVHPGNIPGYSHMQVFQMMLPIDSAVVLLITGLDSVRLSCTGQQLIFQRYQGQPMGRALPGYCDSVIRANKDKDVSAAIILSQFCHEDVAENLIGTYYDLLEIGPKLSFYGKKVGEYLNGRRALQAGKIFGYGILQDSAGKTHRFPWLTSDYTLVCFWFTGSTASKAGFTVLDSLCRISSREKFQVITVSCDDAETQTAWKAYLQKSSWPWMNLLDLNQQTARRYAISTFPTKLVLDRNLKIVKINPTTNELITLINEKSPR